MGQLFSPPAPPNPPRQPIPPQATDPSEIERQNRLILLERIRRGRAKTIATSPRGIAI
jgi:hypothetical protein